MAYAERIFDPAKVELFRFPFSWRSGGLEVLFIGDQSLIIFDVRIVVDTAFGDPAATIQIGTVHDHAAIFDAADATLSIEGEYDDNRVYTLPDAELGQVLMNVIPMSSLVGSGTVIFQLSRGDA